MTNMTWLWSADHLPI